MHEWSWNNDDFGLPRNHVWGQMPKNFKCYLDRFLIYIYLNFSSVFKALLCFWVEQLDINWALRMSTRRDLLAKWLVVAAANFDNFENILFYFFKKTFNLFLFFTSSSNTKIWTLDWRHCSTKRATVFFVNLIESDINLRSFVISTKFYQKELIKKIVKVNSEVKQRMKLIEVIRRLLNTLR